MMNISCMKITEDDCVLLLTFKPGICEKNASIDCE